MPDAYRLARSGSTLDVGSYVLPEPGPNFGFEALFDAHLSQNPAAEGGVLAYEINAPRKFSFPLRLASSAAFTGGLNGLTALVRSLAKPGGTIDLQPDGVATSDAVRFDIIDGRLDESYNIWVNRIGRREMTLALTVQPFGYWPTDIILASVASVAVPGVLTIPSGSILGDVPGLARVTVQPTSMGTSFGAGSWNLDAVFWALGGLGSFNAVISGASMLGGFSASIAGNVRALGSQSIELFPSPTQGGWTTMAYYNVGSLLEPAYRGRFRAFLFARQGEPSSLPWQVALDVMGGLQTNRALASAAFVATIPAEGYSSVISASPAFNLIDLGEIVSPQTASGQDQELRFRIWTTPPTTSVGIASPVISLGGLYLLPLDGGAGVLPRGLAQPSSLTPSVGRFVVDAYSRQALIANLSANLATPLTPLANALAFYQGDFPRVGPSSIKLDLLAGARKAASGATAPLARTSEAFAAASLTYRPRFTFLRGV